MVGVPLTTGLAAALIARVPASALFADGHGHGHMHGRGALGMARLRRAAQPDRRDERRDDETGNRRPAQALRRQERPAARLHPRAEPACPRHRRHRTAPAHGAQNTPMPRGPAGTQVSHRRRCRCSPRAPDLHGHRVPARRLRLARVDHAHAATTTPRIVGGSFAAPTGSAVASARPVRAVRVRRLDPRRHPYRHRHPLCLRPDACTVTSADDIHVSVGLTDLFATGAPRQDLTVTDVVANVRWRRTPAAS